MNEFLRKSKEASQALSSFSKVHVVIGNEACDLDSTVSAIAHAYHLSQDCQSDEEAIIPVLNIPKDEVALRTETTHLLPRCNIQLTDLVYRDDIVLSSIPNLTLTLVDHNVPPESDAGLDRYVVEVIDHRVNSRHDDEDRKISITREMVGSCTTLVARHILERHLEILDNQLVKLLLGTILVDTLNMSEAAGKTTPTDEDIVQRLHKLSPRINLQELFNDAQAAKFDISGLTTAQMLRKDFKSTSSATCKVGFSSVTLPLQDVLNRVDLETSLKNFCEHRFLDVNIIMTIDLEGSRQLAIYSEDPNLRETMEERLQGSVLELERIDSTVTNLSAFDQHNGKASRKVVLPLVEEFLRTLDSDSDHEVEEEPGENGVPGNVEELSSNVNNANVMAEDGQQNGKAEVLDTGVRLLPMSPFDKKSISVDESVTKNLEEEWDEKEAILNAIRAKQEEAERRNLQLEDPPSMRQESLDSVDTMRRGVSMDDEWQDDEYSRQALQGNKNGVKKSEEGQSDAFYKRPVPKDERESGDGAEHTIDGRLASDGVILREKKLTRPNTLLNRLSIQSVNSVFSEGSIDLENISDDDDAEAEKAHNQSKNSGSKDLSGARPKEKRKIRAELSLNLDDAAQHTDDGTTPAILTPTSTEMSWEDDTPMNKAEPIEEYTAREEHEDRWRWRKVNLGGKDYTIDMKAINPYKKVLSHGGYYGEGLNAIIVFASCYLPEKSKKDYTYIMNNLFLYVVSTLELLVAQEYIIIYFHGSASRAKVPSLGWMRKCYQMIDRKLRKSLKGLYLVHPTTWLKAIVQLTKPFISHKFSNKLKFVKSLAELKTLVSMEYVYIPEEVKRFDQNKNKGGGTIWGWIAGPPPVDDEDWFSLEEGYDSDYSITADFLLSPHNPPNWHRRRQRKRLLIKAGNFNFSSDDEAPKEEDADGRRHHRRNLRHHNQQQQPPPPPTSSSHHEDECSVSTPASIGINLGPAISPQDYLTEWYFKRRSQSCSGYIEDDTFSYNHIIETPEVERRTWKDVFGDELGHEDYDGEDEDEGDRNSATESHGQLEISS